MTATLQPAPTPAPGSSTAPATFEAGVVNCPTCHGYGEVPTGRVDWETGSYDTAPCNLCDGRGEVTRLNALHAAVAHIDHAWEYDAPLGIEGGDEMTLIREWTGCTDTGTVRLLLAIHEPEFLDWLDHPAPAAPVLDPWTVPAPPF